MSFLEQKPERARRGLLALERRVGGKKSLINFPFCLYKNAVCICADLANERERKRSAGDLEAAKLKKLRFAKKSLHEAQSSFLSFNF